jgi:transcriptional regulator with XRE-family HTH domain
VEFKGGEAMRCLTCGTELDDSLGTRIRDQRKLKKMSLRVLSEKSGVSAGFLCDVELGKRSMTIDTLKKVAKALQVTPSALID